MKNPELNTKQIMGWFQAAGERCGKCDVCAYMEVKLRVMRAYLEACPLMYGMLLPVWREDPARLAYLDQVMAEVLRVTPEVFATVAKPTLTSIEGTAASFAVVDAMFDLVGEHTDMLRAAHRICFSAEVRAKAKETAERVMREFAPVAEMRYGKITAAMEEEITALTDLMLSEMLSRILSGDAEDMREGEGEGEVGEDLVGDGFPAPTAQG